MNLTTAEYNEAGRVVEELMTELNYAYQGLHTLPDDHRAKQVWVSAQRWLARWQR